MLSVVLYGRNDSHGYNLHKRAAISLNAIAEMLTNADDEILFVDYNSPDELPTFPEAIADTLTEKATRLLRILRVRPEAHRTRFAHKTHLVALEPIARNVAIRRSNPKNRWVLSTNTDMIFCPLQEGQSLSTIASGLEDGFYHLPRFELPEGLWETLDRKDAARIISTTREWGRQFHLNEITLSGNDNLYDGPGDFQLFLRGDLDRIGGFHEEMIRGWHLDANIAKRMRLLRGNVSSALDHLIGYHCDHTRQASAYHKADRLENDPVRFVDAVTAPEIPEQMATWGLADLEVEDFRVNEASAHRYLKGLKSVISAPLEGFTETAYVAEAYGRLGYDADHVLPYLLDLVSCVPERATVAYVGARRDLFQGLAKGWAAMGGTRPVIIPDTAPWLADAGGAPVKVLPLEAWAQEADMFIFEVGAERAANQADVDAEESARLWAVDMAFKTAAARDFARQDAGAAARRAFVVNGIHNVFEPLVFRAMAVTLTPFSTRIRHGYFADRAKGRMASASPAQKAVAAKLGALEPLSMGEMDRIRALLAETDLSRLNHKAWKAAGKMAGEISALATTDAALLGPVPRLPEVLDSLIANRPSRSPAAAEFVSPDAGRGAANRLVRLEDWDDSEWAALAAWLYGTVDHANLFTRERWMWERVTLTQNLIRDVPPGTGAKVLLVGRDPEAHAFALAQMGYAVDIVHPASLAQGKLDAADWRQTYAHDGWMAAHPLALASERANAVAAGFRYDAVLVTQNGLFVEGRDRMTEVLRGAAALVRPGGHLGFTATAQVSRHDLGLRDHALPSVAVQDGRLAREIDAATEFELRGQIDDRLTPRTLDRLEEGDGANAAPNLVAGPASHPETAAAFAFRRREGAPAGDWSRVAMLIGGKADLAQASAPKAQRAPASRFLFSDLEDLPPSAGGPARFGSLMGSAVIAKDGVKRTPGGLNVSMGPESHMALHLDVGKLDPGGYELVVEFFTPAGAKSEPVAAFGLIGGDKVVAERVEAGAPAGPRVVDFYFELDEAAASKGLRLAVKSLGGDFDILDMKLR